MVTRTRLTVVAATLLLAGCELADVTIASPKASVVVHAVLNPDAAEQVVLLEATQTGRVDINDNLRYNPLEPIRTAGGVPVNDADVRLLADGDTVGVRAIEGVVSGRKTGRYTIARSALAVLPGRHYRLRVRSTDGAVVTGETTVPSALAGAPAVVSTPAQLNRSTDTLRLEWGAVRDATIYGIRIDTPDGPWFLFSDSTHFALSGGLRNFFAPGLPSVWFPGFVQPLTVIASDKNFYDYNRSGNDPFGGSGLISSVQGGLGLFGSVRMVVRRDVTVTDAVRAPIDGRWLGTTSVGSAVTMNLWRESAGATASSLSGSQRIGTTDKYIVGTLQGETLRLATLAGIFKSDTVAFFTGRFAGDSITGTYSSRFAIDGPKTFRR